MAKKYEPKLRKNRFQRFINLFILISTALLWVFSGKLQLEITTLLPLTGIAFLILILSSQNRRKEIENYETAKALQKMRESQNTPKYYDEELGMRNEE